MEAALIAGVTTPEVFRLSFDLKSLPGDGQANFGHLGGIWGVPAGASYPLNQFNAAYARIHSDHITHWSYAMRPTEHIFPVGSLVDNTVYRMQIEVDYPQKVMTTRFWIGQTEYTRTYTGADFDQINYESGGRIGLISWGDHIAYNNIVLEDLSVPEPEPAALLALVLGAFALGVGRRR